jgi:hypothetical protein
MKSVIKMFLLMVLMSVTFMMPAQTPIDLNIVEDSIMIDTATVDLNAEFNEIKDSLEKIKEGFPTVINTKEQLDGLVIFLFGLLVLLGGYVSKFVPGLKAINDNAYRVFALAISLVLSFTLFKGDLSISDGVNYFIGYGGAATVYSLIFKRVKRTPSPVPTLAA